MSAALLALGTAVPRGSVTQRDAAMLAQRLCVAGDDEARILNAIYRRSGVRRRSTVLLDGEYTPETSHAFYPAAKDANDRGPSTGERMRRYAAEASALALAAGRAALDRAGMDGQSVSHIITVSCTGFAAPGLDAALIRGLELPATCARTHVGFMGCHGAINALRVAAAFCAGDPSARVLLCAAELCSLHFRYSLGADAVVANALFGDGAAAAVLAHDASPQDRPSARPPDAWRLAATGSCLFPDSLDAMTWTIGDHGFEMTLSARVPSLLERHLRPWLERWLAAAGLGVRDVRSWAIHPGGPRIVQSVVASLGLPEGADAPSRAVLGEHGNMSSPTILFILDRLRQSGAPRPCVALAFGPGLVAEAALFV